MSAKAGALTLEGEDDMKTSEKTTAWVCYLYRTESSGARGCGKTKTAARVAADVGWRENFGDAIPARVEYKQVTP